jgi:antitoxin VapB
MDVDHVVVVIPEPTMALQIANPAGVSKVERLARGTGRSKTAAVEHAVDRLLGVTPAAKSDASARLAALLAQLDRIPDRPDATDPLPWDDRGLPK